MTENLPKAEFDYSLVSVSDGSRFIINFPKDLVTKKVIDPKKPIHIKIYQE